MSLSRFDLTSRYVEASIYLAPFVSPRLVFVSPSSVSTVMVGSRTTRSSTSGNTPARGFAVMLTRQQGVKPLMPPVLVLSVRLTREPWRSQHHPKPILLPAKRRNRNKDHLAHPHPPSTTRSPGVRYRSRGRRRMPPRLRPQSPWVGWSFSCLRSN